MSNDCIKTGIVGKSQITIGRFTYGIENLSIKQWNEGAALRIGGFCSLAADITIFLGGNHRTDWISTFPFGTVYQSELGGTHLKGHPSTKGDVVIGNDVWIGTGVTIMSGVHIGDGAVIGANSCVVRNVAPYEIVAGNPARFLKRRFDDELVHLLLLLRWWDLPISVVRSMEQTLCSPPDGGVLKKLVEEHRGVVLPLLKE